MTNTVCYWLVILVASTLSTTVSSVLLDPDPTSMPSSQPSRQPSRQPTGQPSGQPSANPTLNTESYLTSGILRVTDIAVGVKYLFQNIGHPDANWYLTIKVYNTGFNYPSSNILETIIGEGSESFISQCTSVQIPDRCDNTQACNSEQFKCLVNFRATPFISTKLGGSLSLQTKAKNFLFVTCLCSGYQLIIQYDLNYLYGQPTLFPTMPPKLTDGSGYKNPGLSIYVGMDYLYVSIMTLAILIPTVLGFMVDKFRELYNKDLIYRINKKELFLFPLISYVFFGNWIYTIVSSFVFNKSDNSIGILIVNILSIILRCSSIILVLYIQKYINDPVSYGSLYHKIADDRRQVSLEDSQFLFQLVSFVMYVNPDSVKILPWKRTTFTDVSSGYPSYWLYKYCLNYQLLFSFFSLLLTIAKFSLSEVTLANIINIAFIVIYLLSLKSSHVYSLVRGKLSLDYEKYDDEDDEEKRKEAGIKLSSSGDNEMVDFNSFRNSITMLNPEEKDEIDPSVLAEKYSVMMAELNAKKEEIEEREHKLSEDSSNSRSLSINDQDAEIQRNQLKELGIVPLVFIALADIRKEVNSMISGEINMNDNRFDYLMKCMLVNPEFIEEQKRERLKWVQEITPVCRGWYDEMNRIIPSIINMTSAADLEKAGYPKALAFRLTTKKCLWLIKMDPEKIRKIHIADFRGKYSYQSQGLDITELAAIYMSLPQTYENDGKGDKMRFKTELEDKLSVSYKEFKQGKLKPALVRHPVYASFDPTKVQLEVNKRLSYSFKSQKEDVDKTVVASSDLENQVVIINPMTAVDGADGGDGNCIGSHEDLNTHFKVAAGAPTVHFRSDVKKMTSRSDLQPHVESMTNTETGLDDCSNGRTKTNSIKSRVTAPPGLLEIIQKSKSTNEVGGSSPLTINRPAAPLTNSIKAPPGLFDALKAVADKKKQAQSMN